MKETLKDPAVLILAVALVFVGGMGVGKTLNNNAPSKDTREAPREAEGETASPATSSSPKPAAAATRDPVAECETALRNDFASRGGSFEQGSIIVAFAKGVTFGRATEILDSVGLEPHNSPDPREAYDAQGWLTVKTPRGREIRLACELRQKPEVRTARLNETFELAE